jgi:hypothetical protein
MVDGRLGMMLAAGCNAGMGEYNPYTGSYDDIPGPTVPDYSPIYTPEPGGPEIQPVKDWVPPGIYELSTGQQVQFGGGNSDALARMLAPVIPGVLNIITGMYQPPAYETVTGPGGSRTTIRVPGTVAGQPAQVIPGINTNTIMIVAAVAAAVLLMNRR